MAPADKPPGLNEPFTAPSSGAVSFAHIEWGTNPAEKAQSDPVFGGYLRVFDRRSFHPRLQDRTNLPSKQ
jgi:hypothetical protein